MVHGESWAGHGVIGRDMSVDAEEGALDIELEWQGQTVRVQHPRNGRWFMLIVTEGARELAAVRMDTVLAGHLSELFADVYDRVTESGA